MARVKRGVAAKRRHKKVLEQAKGYYGNKSRSFRAANEQVMRSGQYAFRDRRARKGEFRRLWIQRINAGDPPARHVLQPVHRRPERGRHRGRPQDPRRSRRHRRRRLRPPRRGGQGGALSDRRERPSARRSPTPRSNGCGASWGAAVRVPRKARSSSRGRCCRRGARRRVGGRGPVRRARRRRRSTAPAPVRELGRRASPSGSPPPRRRPGCSPSSRIPAADAGVLAAADVRRRRRPHRRSRQPRHDPALGRGRRRRRRRAHAGHGRRVQPEGRAGVGRGAVPRARRRRRRSTTCARAGLRLDRHVVAPRRRRTPTPTGPAGWRSSPAARPTACADDAPVDEWVRIEHHGRAESLNVAMADDRAVLRGGPGAALTDRVVSPPVRRLSWRPCTDWRDADFGAPGEPGDGELRLSTAPPPESIRGRSRRLTLKGLPLIDDIRAAREAALDRIAAATTLDDVTALDAAAARQARRPRPAEDPARLARPPSRSARPAGQQLNEATAAAAAALAGRARRARRDASAAPASRPSASTSPSSSASPARGHAHLVTQAWERLEDVFIGLGFQIAEGPEVETDWHNFEALNMGDEPSGPQRLRHAVRRPRRRRARHAPCCARTRRRCRSARCSPSAPPIYIVAPGRVFRRDTPDATHMPVFHQIEGLVVDRDITLAAPRRHDRGVHQGVLRAGLHVAAAAELLPVHRAVGRVRHPHARAASGSSSAGAAWSTPTCCAPAASTPRSGAASPSASASTAWPRSATPSATSARCSPATSASWSSSDR